MISRLWTLEASGKEEDGVTPSPDKTRHQRHSIRRAIRTNLAILVFIAILTVGAVLLDIPARWFEEGAKLAPAKGDFQSISSALHTYKINVGHYPSTEQGLQALVERPTIPPLPDDWVKIADKVPTDPWKNEYRYRCFPEGSPYPFELISNGPDGMEGTKDDRSSLHQPHPNSKP
jgi:general secretion pathway protein G